MVHGYTFNIILMGLWAYLHSEIPWLKGGDAVAAPLDPPMPYIKYPILLLLTYLCWFLQKKPVPIITHHVVEPDIYSEPEEKLDELWEEMMHITLVEDLRTNVDGFIQMCTNPLSDEALIEKLESMKFDLAIVDTFVCSRYVQSTPLNSHPVNWHFPFNSDSSSVHNYTWNYLSNCW